MQSIDSFPVHVFLSNVWLFGSLACTYFQTNRHKNLELCALSRSSSFRYLILFDYKLIWNALRSAMSTKQPPRQRKQQTTTTTSITKPKTTAEATIYKEKKIRKKNIFRWLQDVTSHTCKVQFKRCSFLLKTTFRAYRCGVSMWPKTYVSTRRRHCFRSANVLFSSQITSNIVRSLLFGYLLMGFLSAIRCCAKFSTGK